MRPELIVAAVCGLGALALVLRPLFVRVERHDQIVPPPLSPTIAPDEAHRAEHIPDSGRDREWLENQVERRRILRRVK